MAQQHTVTIELPESIYEQIHDAAQKKNRSVDDMLIEAITAAAPVMDVPVSQLRSALAQMTYLNDAALWQAGRATLSPEQRQRMEALHHKQQREGLTTEELAEAEALEALYRDTLLVRAQAALLLKQRNYDVSDPRLFAPLQ